jgi:hypothetical protein
MSTKLRRPNGTYYEMAAQPATVAAVAGEVPAGGTGATAGAYDTANNRNTMIATVAEIKASLNDLIDKLKTAGIIASS